MKLTKEHLAELAETAMIALPEKTARRYMEEMKDLYDLAELLPPTEQSEADLLSAVAEGTDVREDRPGRTLQAETVFAMAPAICAGCVAVPAVMEEKK